MTNSPPSASVTFLIAAYNAAPFIREALESCFAQTRLANEIVVVDDASTDGTGAVLDEYALAGWVRLIRNPANLGRDRSVNSVLPTLQTRYVAFLDADDVAVPHRLERQVEFMEAHPKVGCLSSFVRYINAQGRPLAQSKLDVLTLQDLDRYLHSNEPFGLYYPAAILRCEVFQNPALRLRPEFWPASDIDLWNRIAEAGWQVLALPECLTRYRIHSHSAVTTQARHARFQYEWLRACLRARRAGRPEPTREQFQAQLDQMPWFARLNRFRKVEAKAACRAASFAYAEGHRFRAAAKLFKALCLQPAYVVHRLTKGFAAS